MNVKKIILTALCVLAATVAAQYAYAQSPSMEARYMGEIWQAAFGTDNQPEEKQDTTATSTQEEPAQEEQTQEQPAQDENADAQNTVQYWNGGREMKIVNGAEQVCRCVGGACKCAYHCLIKGADKIPNGIESGREGHVMRVGDALFQNDKTTTQKADSLASSLERANTQAALKHAETQK